MKMRNSVVCLLCAMPVALWAQARTQTVVLRDGTQVTGRIVRATTYDITVRDQSQKLRRFNFDQLASINFYDLQNSSRGDVYNGAPQGTYRNQNPGQRPPDYNAGNNDTGNYRYGSISLRAGSEITVRTNETIDSGQANQERSYSAQVDRDVADDNGNVLIPRGAAAVLVVRNIGDNRIALDLQSVTVNGDRYVLNSEQVTQAGRQGVGSNRRTGEFVGGGAVLGTLLGAIAGGGKGAAIGALAGGGAGLGAEVLTKGDRVRVPAETILNFRLENAVRFNTVR
jgi:hypothetical protein